MEFKLVHEEAEVGEFPGTVRAHMGVERTTRICSNVPGPGKKEFALPASGSGGCSRGRLLKYQTRSVGVQLVGERRRR